MAFPLQLLEILTDCLVYLLYAVHNHKNSDWIRVNAAGDQPYDVVLDALDAVLKHLLVLAVHADTDRQLKSLPSCCILVGPALEIGDEVILGVVFEILEGFGGLYFFEVLQLVAIFHDAINFNCLPYAARQLPDNDISHLALALQSQLNGLQKDPVHVIIIVDLLEDQLPEVVLALHSSLVI